MSSNLTRLTTLPDGVIGNIQEFDSCVAGSIPALVANGGCSLFGKASDCASEEQGSNPAVHPEEHRIRNRRTRNAELFHDTSFLVPCLIFKNGS